MTIKLNDAQTVLVNRTARRADYAIPAFEFAAMKDRRTFAIAIAALVKKGFATTSTGLKGAAKDGDYANADGRRVCLTKEFVAEYFADEIETPAPKKAKKAPKATQAVVVAAPVVVAVETPSPVEDESIEDIDGRRNSVVAPGYKLNYFELKKVGGSGQGCNDALDQWMTAEFMTEGRGSRRRLNMPNLLHFAHENGVDTDRWVGRNNGMIRMNIAKQIRVLWARGQNITSHGVVVFKSSKVAEAA
tara:strand:+ start:780 stop:1517 length:738 start_codon:yes stop_codon:yes gene_type:complete